MRRIRRAQEYALPGPKECWHPYSLQSLRPEEFSSVVNSILRGDNRLVAVSRVKRKTVQEYRPLF